MNVAIVGYATEGKVSANYFYSLGHTVTICDQDATTQVPSDFKSQLGDLYLQNLDRFDVIVRSAGISPNVLLTKNPTIEPKITTAVNEFLRVCPTKNTIGITGTKGKGTTSTLVTKILEAAGHTVFLGGNIGRSPLDFLNEIKSNDFVVLELSSFQLCDMSHATHFATCLMVVPEHLNWHTDMTDYTTAKKQLFRHQTEHDFAVYYADNATSKDIASVSPAAKIPFYAPPGAFVQDDNIVIDNQTVCSTDELSLLGSHNWQNICAAVTTVWLAGVHNTDAIRSVLTTFKGLEHRLEFVRELDGVSYYDDSFGTTPETAVVALRSFTNPKVLILGGSDKGAQYDELAQAIHEDAVRKVILIGDQAERIRISLDAIGFHNYAYGGDTMTDIVKTAHSAAESGDVVLLSTGCASFGLFNDYKDRGDQFKHAVHLL